MKYLAIFSPKKCIHGNSKVNTSDYIKTPLHIRNQIKSKVKLVPPRKIYSDMTLNDTDGPRDSAQVRNYKYNVLKNDQKSKYKKNVADDLQNIMNIFHESKIIQEIIQTKNNPPNIILYNEHHY